MQIFRLKKWLVWPLDWFEIVLPNWLHTALFFVKCKCPNGYSVHGRGLHGGALSWQALSWFGLQASTRAQPSWQFQKHRIAFLYYSNIAVFETLTRSINLMLNPFTYVWSENRHVLCMKLIICYVKLNFEEIPPINPF
jgi:hypothetical protein